MSGQLTSEAQEWRRCVTTEFQGKKRRRSRQKSFSFPSISLTLHSFLRIKRSQNKLENKESANWPIGFDINEIYSVHSVIIGWNILYTWGPRNFDMYEFDMYMFDMYKGSGVLNQSNHKKAGSRT